jgi:hypothetical protein
MNTTQPPPAIPYRRSRRWEKEHLGHKVIYRGVDPTLALRVRSIAGELCVPTGEVARAFLEYALRSTERGDLDLLPRPDPQRMRNTLFPQKKSSRPRSKGQRHKPAALWRVVTTWRNFSPDLKRELAALASAEGLNIPIGELITVLLKFGLQAYAHRLLALEPVFKGGESFTLFPEEGG